MSKTFLALVICLVSLQSAMADNTISLSWPTIPQATGYKVYYGEASGNYGNSINVGKNAEVGQFASITIGGLADCTKYYLAVKAYNSTNESPKYSKEVIGWPRPRIDSKTLTHSDQPLKQGDEASIEILGANFEPQATVRILEPVIVPFQPPLFIPFKVSKVQWHDCGRLTVSFVVPPDWNGGEPAWIGAPRVTGPSPTDPVAALNIAVINPDHVFGDTKLTDVRIGIDPARLDVAQGNSLGRIDNEDLADLKKASMPAPYKPRFDFDGDRRVDGNDFAFLAANYCKCWDLEDHSWTKDACDFLEIPDQKSGCLDKEEDLDDFLSDPNRPRSGNLPRRERSDPFTNSRDTPSNRR